MGPDAGGVAVFDIEQGAPGANGASGSSTSTGSGNPFETGAGGAGPLPRDHRVAALAVGGALHAVPVSA